MTRVGWSRVAFGDVVDHVTERVDDPSEAGVDRYVGLEHLDPGILRITRWGSPSDVEATKLRFRPGDVIFGKRRAYQRKLAQADFAGICSAHAMVLRTKSDSLLGDFLPVLMQSETFHQRALAISVGSLSPTINWKTLAKEEFDLPPIDEQRRLVDIVRHIDLLEGHYGDLLRCADVALKSLAQDALASVTDPVPLASVATLKGGSAFPHSFQGERAGDFPFIKVSDMELAGNESYITSAMNYVSQLQLRELGASVFPSGTVVLAKVGAAVFQQRLRILAEPTAIDNNMLAVTPTRHLEPEYLRLMLKGIDLARLVQPGPIPAISTKYLAAVQVSVPAHKVQMDIIGVAAKLNEAVQGSSAAGRRLAMFRRATVTELLTV